MNKDELIAKITKIIENLDRMNISEHKWYYRVSSTYRISADDRPNLVITVEEEF